MIWWPLKRPVFCHFFTTCKGMAPSSLHNSDMSTPDAGCCSGSKSCRSHSLDLAYKSAVCMSSCSTLPSSLASLLLSLCTCCTRPQSLWAQSPCVDRLDRVSSRHRCLSSAPLHMCDTLHAAP